MYQLVLYVTRFDEKLVGKPKPYGQAFRKWERVNAKYPDRRYSLRKV